MPAHSNNVLTLSELLHGIAAVDARDDCEVFGLASDSRKVKKGDCFVALSGTRSHGVQFAHQAIAAGAVAVLIEDVELALGGSIPVIRIDRLRKELGRIAGRFYGDPSQSLDVIAVTGTNGKTTVALLCAQSLKRLHGDAGYAGTLGIGRLGDLSETATTTPDPITLHEFFSNLRNHASRGAAIEVSSHAISQSRVVGVAIDVAILTNIGHDHLDYHGTREAYIEAKKSLFANEDLEHAVINIDDDVGRELAEELSAKTRCWTYSSRTKISGRSDARHLYLTRFAGDIGGSTVAVATPQGEVEITTPLIGDFNAQNIVASLGALMALGNDAEPAARALSSASGVPGRLEIVDDGAERGPVVVVDYAHTPESLSRVLVALRPMTDRKLICVFGCGGDRDKSKRGPMGSAAERGADTVIVTSDNPRGESNEEIVAQILGGMRAAGDVAVIHDRSKAIAAGIDAACSGDVVLIAGKGHEQYQEICGERHLFSDSETASRVLHGLGS